MNKFARNLKFLSALCCAVQLGVASVAWAETINDDLTVASNLVVQGTLSVTNITSYLFLDWYAFPLTISGFPARCGEYGGGDVLITGGGGR